MNLLFDGAVAGNGFNSLGHYVRAEPLVSSCTDYATRPVPGARPTSPAARPRRASAARPRRQRTGEPARATARRPSRPTGSSAQARAKSRPSEQARRIGHVDAEGLLGYLIGGGR